LLNALVLQCGTTAKAASVLQDSWEPGMKSEDKERLTGELHKLQNHPLLKREAVEPVPTVTTPRVEPLDPLEAAGRAWSSPYVVGDLDDLLGKLLGQKGPPVRPIVLSPLLEELRKYAEAAAVFFQQKRYLKAPLDHHRVVEVEGLMYVLMYTAVLRKGQVAINLNGTSGAAKKLLDLDETYLASPAGRRCYVHECVIEGYQSSAFTAFAAHLVPGRNYRFWVSRRGQESQDFLKIHTTMDEEGCVLDNSTIILKNTWSDYVNLFA